MLNRGRALLSALLLCSAFARAQTIAFEFQTYPDSPIALVRYTPGTVRLQSDRRQFLTVKNQSDKAAAAMLFQVAVPSGPKTEILSLERVSIMIRSRETKRLSVSVEDIWNRAQRAAQAGQTMGKPALSVVAVEFIDGSVWSAPAEGSHK